MSQIAPITAIVTYAPKQRSDEIYLYSQGVCIPPLQSTLAGLPTYTNNTGSWTVLRYTSGVSHTFSVDNKGNKQN